MKGTKNEIKDMQLEKCNIEFITAKKEKLESDILFKIKGRRIFILIEQQSKVDFWMAKRILYYYVEIMREVEKEGIEKQKTLPIIYPIVLYTGKTKWSAKIQIKDLQEEIEGINKSLSLYYNLVDINNISKEELIKERSSISKALLMEKIRNKKELIEILEKITKENLTLTEKNFIIDILTNIVTNEIGLEKTQELKEKIEDFKKEDIMVTENLRNIFRMNYNEGVEFGIQKGIKSGIKSGIQKGIKTGTKSGIQIGMKTATNNIVIQMLKNEISDETIKKVTKIKDKELQKIKKVLKKF